MENKWDSGLMDFSTQNVESSKI